MTMGTVVISQAENPGYFFGGEVGGYTLFMHLIRIVNYNLGTQLTIVLIGILALFWRVDLEKNISHGCGSKIIITRWWFQSFSFSPRKLGI